MNLELELMVPYALVYKGEIHESTEFVQIDARKRFGDLQIQLILERGQPGITGYSNLYPVYLWYLSQPIQFGEKGPLQLQDCGKPLPTHLTLSSKTLTDDNGGVYIAAELPRKPGTLHNSSNKTNAAAIYANLTVMHL